MPDSLKYLSDAAITQLRRDVGQNIDRYRGGGFEDLASDPGWDIPLGLEFDAELFSTLDLEQPKVIAPVDMKNSLIVGRALSNLDPSTANEERIWVRLAHIEAFDYCRIRWLSTLSDDQIPGQVEKHFFAPHQTGIRDDHALSRLWWNNQIATICQPEDVESALKLIMKTADIRSNFVERIWMTSRRRISGAVLRAMQFEPWITEAEANFREFMKAVNRLGGGVVFETLSDDETDSFVADCVKHAKAA